MIKITVNKGVIDSDICFEKGTDNNEKTLEFVFAFHALVESMADMAETSYDIAKINLLINAANTEKDYLSEEIEEKKEP